MQMFMIACHMDNNYNVAGFRIIDTDTGEVKDYNYNSVGAVLNKGIHIDGIELENGKIKGSNGQLSRYTQLIDGITIGKSPVVIVKQYPNNIYDVCDHVGRINTMKEEDIIRFAELEGLANGKIVKTKNKMHISPISGEYPKDKSFNDKDSGDKLKAKMKILGHTKYQLNEMNYAFKTDKSIDKLLLGKGCLGIAIAGFSECINLKEAYLPNTCTYIGAQAFANCHNLESINIPEGVLEIPQKCFVNCKKIKEIKLPNSLQLIDDRAFAGCNLLRHISFGPNKPKMRNPGFATGARIEVRH